MRYRVSKAILSQTFEHFRSCGRGQRECQALWISAWRSPETITDVVHPAHRAHAQGFVLDDLWLNRFWLELAEQDKGIRVQIHTHPRDAFHSATDDAFPIIHTPGFLSLVIPNFAIGPIGLREAFLTEIENDGLWREVRCEQRLEIV
jgi:hypothetical protein